MIAELPPSAVEFIRQLLRVIEAQSVIINQQSVVIARQSAKITELNVKVTDREARLQVNSHDSSKASFVDGPVVEVVAA